MKSAAKKLLALDIPLRTYLFAAGILCAARLLLTAWQKLFLCPEISMLDDMLMYDMARSVVSGNWLGAYSYLAMGKHALFAVWLALLNRLGVSVLFAGQLLFVTAALCAAAALRPLLKNNARRLAFLALLLFSPNSYADFTLRVYRDNITSSVTLIFFACCAGFALRARRGSGRSLWLFGAGAGFSLGAAWLLREDAAWLLPFAALALVLSFFEIFKGARSIARFAALSLLVALPIASISAYSFVNCKNYGRFAVSDLSSPEFADAYGAMTRVIIPKNERNPIIPVPASTREKLYAVSPSFAELREYLEAPDFLRWQKDCGDGQLEFSGGGIYWAVRGAASLAGHYDSPESAKAYYENVANEINAAADSGALGEVLPKRSGLNTPITAQYVGPTLVSSLKSLYTVVTYADLRCDPENSVGSDLLIDEMEQFLHCKSQREHYSFTAAEKPPLSKKVVFWAICDDAPVSARLLAADGSDIRCDNIASSAGDLYLDNLLRGKDLRNTAGARQTLYFENDGAASLELSSGIERISIPAMKTTPVTTSGRITYRVEYAGAAPEVSTEYGVVELWLYRAMRIIVWIYRALGTLLFCAAVYALGRFVIRSASRRKLPKNSGTAFALCLGLLFSAALRIGMVSFADVSAFGLGVYTMYLSAVYPLMTLFECTALVLLSMSLSDKKPQDATDIP